MCRIAFDSMIAERCGASKRLPFLGINQKNNSWMNKKERAFEMYILFDPLIRSNSCIFICDDGHKITSSRVDRLYSPSLSLDFTFQSIFCSFSSLLIYLFGWCVCVFFLLCRSQKYAHIKLKIDWNVCIWNNAWKKTP